jgi:tRNA pseudouridine55 synthase
VVLAVSVEPGLWLTHKPRGATSFETVRAFLREAEQGPKKPPAICHGGTLDPFAEGLLLVLVGPTTQLMDFHHAAPKTYRAELRWGAETDNGDPLGAVTHEGDPSALTAERLHDALLPFLGWTEQVPPPTSAKKLGGEPAYRKVHRGETVVLPPSRVYLHTARWVEHALPERSVLEVVVRGGYYVRSLARDLGRALGCYAHLSRLERPRIGPWDDPGENRREWVPPTELLPWLPSRVLDDQEVGALRSAGMIERRRLEPPRWTPPTGFPVEPRVRAIHQGRLIGVLDEADDGLRVAKLLRGRF